ncbi:MAG: hypothetical protein V3V06_03560 [Dehalococcoidia bacterium]
MTTPASGAREIEVRYEGPAPTFGGYDSADFIIVRPHQARYECNLRLGLDARRLFEERTGPLDDEAAQTVLRALAGRLYPRLVEAGEVPAITLVRASDLEASEVEAVLAEAGLG